MTLQDERYKRELKRLVEVYALRSRELAEAVAALGWLITSGKPIEDAIEGIVRRRILSEEAGADLHLFLKRFEEQRAAGGGE